MFIDKDTIASINPTNNGHYILRFYRDKKVIFEKEYKTFRTAQAVQTRKTNNHEFSKKLFIEIKFS